MEREQDVRGRQGKGSNRREKIKENGKQSG